MIPRIDHPANPEWAAQQVAGLPYRWKKRLFNQWEKEKSELGGSAGNRAAASGLLSMLDRFRSVSVPLDASDADICERSDALAAHCNSLAEVFHDVDALREAMSRVCGANGIDAPKGKKITPQGAVARMVCPFWWRRQLRKLHAKAVEGGAIAMGYVNKTRDIYVSNESLVRRRQQNRRNTTMLENTKAVNEDGQEFTLAELAAKGTANKSIRRGELMTRIAGFERIAVDCNHVGLFFTMTAPSRMHKWRTVAGGRVVENRKYDGTTPKQAQAHHSKTWARIRAKLGRCGFGWYGFRIAEPNHDGTPHWHLLVFFDSSWPGGNGRAALPRVCAIVRRYALMESGNEAGAKKHRVDFKPMDASKGTAAGYIAKYVSKNIDGHKVEKDLFGNDAITTAQRVEAWAATWGIRQFQQVGGPPVTVWRELRRVAQVPADAPAFLIDAHSACNKVARGEDGAESVAWDLYTRAQGGVFCGRSYRIRLATEEQAGSGRYGDALGVRPVGVAAVGEKTVTDGICSYTVSFKWLVKSARRVWEIIRGGGSDFNRRVASAWTRVNNCTRENFAELGKKFAVPKSSGSPAYFEFCGPINWPAMEKELKNG